jgi:hypothetical protein
MTLPPPIPQLYIPTPQKKVDHASVWQLVLGVISMINIFALAAGVIFLAAMSKSSSPELSLSLNKLTPYLILAAGLQVAVFFSVFFAIRKLMGHTSASIWINKWHLLIAAILLVGWGIVIYFGSTSNFWGHLGAIEIPVKILSILAPIYAFVSLALYHLQAGPRQRGWGLFNVTSFVSMFVILLVEIVLLVAGVGAAFAWLSKKVDLYGYFLALSNGAQMGAQDAQLLVQQITPFVDKNMLIVICLLFFSVLAPLTEELLKPLGVWFLAGKKLTPSEGFAAGVFCGATFGVLESLSMLSVSNDLWQVLVVARVGTALMHTLTAGLTGWALAKTWQDHRYSRLSFTYLAVVLIHGVWNAFAILMGLINIGQPSNSAFLTFLMSNSTWFLAGLGVIMLFMLLFMNYRLRKSLTPPEIPIFSDTLVDHIEQ